METVEALVTIPQPRQDEYKPEVDFYTRAMLYVIDDPEKSELSADDLSLIVFIGRQGVLSEALDKTFDPSKRQAIFEQQSTLETANPGLREQSANLRQTLVRL